MSVATAFNPRSYTAALTTNATPSTSTSVQLTAAAMGIPTYTAFPPQARMVNRGSADVFVSFTTASTAAVLPTAGTSTIGTPTNGWYLIPGIVEVFTLPTGDVVWLNYICTAASQVFYVALGEGM